MSRRNRSRSFLERTLASLVVAIERWLTAEELAHVNGFLQRLDPRIKLAGMLLWIVAAVTSRSLDVVLGLFVAAWTIAFFSQVAFWTLGKRVWLPVLFFTGAISLPALFVTPGRVIWRAPDLGLRITAQGITSAAFLVSRAEVAATLAVLLTLCTPWSQVLKALRVFRTPAVVVVILGMTYRYITLLLQTARDMFESRQSRIVGKLSGR